MRSPKVEMLEPVAKAETREELVSFLAREEAPESWRDGRWGKSFKKGSVLEWYNKPYSTDIDRCIVEVPSKEDYAQQLYEAAKQDWEEKIGSIPNVAQVSGVVEICLDYPLTGEMLKQQLRTKGIFDLRHNTHTCSLCGYECGYVLQQGELYYDSGCSCTYQSNNLEPRDWQSLADVYNSLTDLDRKAEFEKIWSLV